MYYSSGNFEAYASPARPFVSEMNTVYILGSGLAGLAAAFFLVRDAKYPGEKIHILEKNPLPGGAMDGYDFKGVGYVARGDRAFDVHAECLWDMLRSIPSASNPHQSVLDEIYNLGKKDPNYSIFPVTEKGGQDAHMGTRYSLTDKQSAEVFSIALAPDTALQGKAVGELLSDGAMSSAFWLTWQSLFGFDANSGALELKRSMLRQVHQVDGILNRRAFRYTAANQYESVILPIVKWLEATGVVFEYGVKVVNVAFDTATDRKYATRIDLIRGESEECIDLTERDFVFIAPGGCVENSSMGSQNEAAVFAPTPEPGSGWDLWKRIAEQDSAFGHPEVFCGSPEHSCRMSATLTTLDSRIVSRIKKLCKRDTFSGKVVSGGPIICRDSGWLLSWTVSRQPQYGSQEDGRVVVWINGVHCNRPGNYIIKSMRDCTGREICAEWLYHIGVPADEIEDLAEHSASTIPVIMPYLASPLMPRSLGDRPETMPKGAVNFAFIGQFAEVQREASRTTEYAVRTAMEAVYSAMHVDRGVPEPWNGSYDLRTLLSAAVRVRDGRPLSDMEMSFLDKRLFNMLQKKLEGTDIEAILRENRAL